MNRLLFAAMMFVATSADAAPILWAVADGGNGHYYERLPETNWHDAKAIADSSSFMGLQGYLVTITSSAENDFIMANVTADFAYAGASDAETEGTWKWVSGPEAGQVFWQDGVSIGYSDWFAGEPNNGSGIEDYLMINYLDTDWNDERGIGPYGFVVEYGGLPVENAVVPESSACLLWLPMIGMAILGTGCRPAWL